MGADNSVFNVTLKAIMDIGDVKHNVDALQNSFKKLKLPDKIGDNLQKNISNFMKEYDKYQNKLAQGIQTQGDQRAVNKSLNSMLNSYEKIISEFDNLSKKDFKDIFNLDEGAFKKVQSTIKQMQAEIKKVKLDPKQLTEPIEQISKLTKANAVFGSGKGFDKIKLGFDDNNIEKAKEGLADIDKYLERFRSQMSDNKYKGIQEALDPIREHVAQAERETQKFTGTLDRAEKELQDLGAAGTRGLKNTADALKKSGQAAEKLTDTLKRQHEEEFNFNRQAQDIDRQIQSYFGLTQMIRKVGDIAREAFNTVKELDAAMVQTAVVTNFDVGDMWNMLPTYTEQANQLGATIKDVYEAATLYYQQGLNTNQAMGLANETLKMARIAGLDAADATNMMTAALRGFNMEINQTSAQKINDIYSELAAITASDTKEIGSAMERTASIANSANMDFATTSAFLAQMIETTREAPENLGTAMKTIVARFQEMKQDPTKLVDSEGVAMDANKVDAALKTIGVNLTNTRGEFRNLDEVFLDISAKWDSLTQGQQRYIATIAAGSRQQSRFIAMMSDYNRTMELVDAANNSAGASQKQFEKTLDSMSTKLNQLKNAWDQFTMGLMNNQIIKFGIDRLTDGFTVINKIIDLLSGKIPDPFGGLVKSALTLATTLGMLNFGKKASHGLVLGGIGWWKGDKSFTKGFSEGYKQSGKTGFLSNKKDNSIIAKAKMDASAYKATVQNELSKNGLASAISMAWKGRKQSFDFANTFNAAFGQFNGARFAASWSADIEAEITRVLNSVIDDAAKIGATTGKKYKANLITELKAGNISGEQLINSVEKVSGQNIGSIEVNPQKINDGAEAAANFSTKINTAGEGLMHFGILLENTPLAPFGALLQTVGMGLTSLGGAVGWVSATWTAGITTASGATLTGVAAMKAGFAALFSEILGFFATNPVGWILLAVAGIAAAVKTIDLLWESNAEKMERATDAAAKASEAYDSAKQETSELADAISQIQDNDNAFDNLVAGTAEFNEKLVEANQKITELINKYPMLNDPKYLSTDENGLMHITQAGLDYVKEYQKQRQNNAAALSAIQTAQLNSEENRQKASKLRQGDIFGTETEESYKKRLQEAEYLEKSAEAAEKVAQQTAISSSLASDEIKNREKISAMYAGQYDDLVKQVDTTKMGIEEMRQAYADFYGYTYNKSTKEMTDVEGNVVLTKDDDQVIKDAIPDITVLTNFEANASSLDNMIDSIDKKFAKGMGSSLKDSGNLLTDILSDNIETNEDALRELIQDPGKIVEGIEKLDEKEIAALLNISEEQVNGHREEFAKVLENKVQKEATNIADAQSKSYEDLAAMMAQTTYGTIEHATNYAGGGWITSQINRLTAEQAHTMSNIGTALRDNVGPEAMSVFIEDATDIYTNAGQKTIDKFNTIIGEVNWESATSRLEGYNKAIDSSNERIQEWGHSMRNSTEEANILGESFNEFLGGDWTELSENADDFKNAMGEIDAEGILKASEQSKTLKTLLDSGEVSANAVAKALQGVEEGKFSFGEVNGVVLQLISSLDRLSEVGAEAHRIIENFDAGIDTGEGEDFVKDNAEKASEYYENNEWGNEQLHNYIKLAAGTEEWNKTLRKNHGDLEATTKSLMKYVTTFKDGFGPAWEQLVNGKNIDGKGLEKAIEDSHVDEALKKKFKDVKFFTDEDGFLNVDAAELTTKELQTYFEEVYGVSEEYAALMMQNLQNYDATISSMLQKNDLKETITSDSFQAARGSGKDLILTDAEIETFKAAGGSLKELADAAGTTAKDLKKNSFKVLDEDGERRQDYVKLTQEYAKKFYGEKASLTSLFGIDSLLTDGKLDLSKLVTDTQSKGFDQEQAMQAAYAAYRKSEKTGETTLYDGMELEKGLASYEEFTAAIEKVTESSQWYDVGQAIAEGIISYIENGNSKDNETGTVSGRPSDVGTGGSQSTEETKIKKDIEAYRQFIAEMGQSGKEAYNYYKKNGFGNTDLSNRQVLDWGKNPTKNKNFAAAATWFTDEDGNQLSDKDVSKKLKNKESTYLSSSMGFGEGENTVEIAFTPMLQTKDGKPQMLSHDAVTSYLKQVVAQATNESGKIDTSKLLELDKTGITTEDGQTISNLVMGAFKGENAIETANAFTQLEHELGEAEMKGLSLEKVLKGIKFTPKIEGAELEKYVNKIDGLTNGQKEILLNTELSGEEKATQFLESVEKEFGGSDKKKKDFIIGAAVNFSQGDEKEGLEILKKAGFSDKEAQQIKQKLNVAYDPKITNESEVQSSIKKQLGKITTDDNLKQTLKIKAKAEVTTSKKAITQKVALKSSGKIENEPGDLKKNIQYTANKKVINEPKNLERTVKYTADTSGIGSLNQTATLTLNISENSKKFNVVRAEKGMNNKISFSPLPQFGSAAKGQYGKVGPRGKGGLTLTGEKGFEIAWLPSESRSMILGAGGPQMTSLPSDAVVYTHEQSKEILKRKSIPAGSHANPPGKSGIKVGGGADTTSSSSQSSKDNKKKDDNKKKKEESKQTKAKAKIIDKAGKLSVWWENQTRKIDSLQRRVDKSSKDFEKAIGKVGATFDSVNKATQDYVSNLNKTIKYNRQSEKKANQNLIKLNTNPAAKKAKADVKAAKIAVKNAKKTKTTKDDKKAAKRLKKAQKKRDNALTTISYERTKVKGKKKTKVTKKTKVNLADYIKYDSDTGAYIVDQAKISKVAKTSKSKAKAINDAATKQLDNYQGKKNTAQDNITKAQEELDKLSQKLYDTFLGWEVELTKIWNLTQQIAAIESETNRLKEAITLNESMLASGLAEANNQFNKNTITIFNAQLKSMGEAIGKRTGLIAEQINVIEDTLSGKGDQELLNQTNDKLTADKKAQEKKQELAEKKAAAAKAKKQMAAAKREAQLATATAAANGSTPALVKKANKAWQKYVKARQTYEKKQTQVQSVQTAYKNASSNLLSDDARLAFEKQVEQLVDNEKIREAVNRYTNFIPNGDGTYSIDFNTDLLESDKQDQNRGITEEDAKKIQEYVKNIESLNGELNDLYTNQTQSLNELVTTLSELQEQRADLSEELLSYVEDTQEKELEKIKKLSESINNAIKDLLDEVKQRLTDRRNQEDNIKTEQDISRKQQRLAALQADTSGGHAVEIAQLQKEISDAQQSYGRSLEDQLIDKLQRQADEASKQREQLINLQEAMLETSAKDFNLAKVNEWLENPAQHEEEIRKAWEEAKDFDNQTNARKVVLGGEWKQFWNNLTTNEEKQNSTVTAIKEAETALEKLTEATEALVKKYGEKEAATPIDNYKQAYTNAKDKKDYKWNDDGSVASKYYGTLLARGNKDKTNDKYWGTIGADAFRTMVSRGSKLGYDPGKVARDLAATSALTWEEVLLAARNANFNKNIVQNWSTSDEFKKAFQKIYGAFATGGLASHTGPAWLDGTPSKPELVLNAKDTKNFIALKDVLSHIMSSANNLSDSYGGNATYEININVDHLNNDYDVDKVAERVKKKIVQDSGYRNVTQVRKFR